MIKIKHKYFYLIFVTILSFIAEAKTNGLEFHGAASKYKEDIVIGFNIKHELTTSEHSGLESPDEEKEPKEEIDWNKALTVSYDGITVEGCWSEIDNGETLIFKSIAPGKTYTLEVTGLDTISIEGMKPLEGKNDQACFAVRTYTFDLPFMVFDEYPSISVITSDAFNSLCTVGHDKIKWVVTEKLHGANYSFWTDGSVVMSASRRGGWITPTNPFYGHKKPVFDRYESFIRELFTVAECQPGDTLTVFGELYGGTVLQKEIHYQTEMKYAAFDIFINGVPVDFDRFIYLVNSVGIPSVPLLAESDSLTDAASYHAIFQTNILHDDAISSISNEAEGVVIRPEKHLRTAKGERIILKNKNSKFDEPHKVARNKAKNHGVGHSKEDTAKIKFKNHTSTCFKPKKITLSEDEQKALDGLLLLMTEHMVSSTCGKVGELNDTNVKRITGQLAGEIIKQHKTKTGTVVNKLPNWGKKIRILLEAHIAHELRARMAQI